MKLNNAVSWSQASVMRCNALSGVCDDDDDDDNDNNNNKINHLNSVV